MSASVSRSIGRNIHGAPGRPRGAAFHGKRSHRHLVLTREIAAGFYAPPKTTDPDPAAVAIARRAEGTYKTTISKATARAIANAMTNRGEK